MWSRFLGIGELASQDIMFKHGMREKSNGPHWDLNPRPLKLRADALPTDV